MLRRSQARTRRRLRPKPARRRSSPMSLKADIRTIEAGTAGSVDLNPEIFGLEPRADILHRVVQWQLNKRQAGTHKAKTRGEVNRTGKKLGNQKGSGNARHGSRRSGIFVGGGKAFGPRPRSHATDLPKKVRALGLRHALSSKAKASELIILDRAEVAEAKTKALKAAFGKLGLENVLIIDGAEVNPGFAAAARGIADVDVLPV